MTTKKNSTEHRLTKLEAEVKAICDNLDLFTQHTKDDISEIKTYVSNHLMHGLEKTNNDLKILLERKQGADAITGFLTKCVQISVSIGALIWTTAQIIMIWKGLK